MGHPIRLALIVLAFLAPLGAARAQESGAKPDAADKPKAYVRYPEAPAITFHDASIGGQRFMYVAEADTITLAGEDGKPDATIFHMGYRRAARSLPADDRRETAARDPGNFPDPATRPLTFSFNGGPGSSSVWLHMGIFGPKRVAYADDFGNPGPPPYAVTDNESSLLDVSDFVFIDPVSTGLSRTEEDGKPADFHGVEQDIRSVAEFIRRYISDNGRWSSPIFIAGESYGTTRAAALAEHLFEQHGITVNGVILVSAVLNFQTIRFNTGNDLPYVLFLPTYTATAHFHGALTGPNAARPLPELLREAEAFALGEYATALLKGSAISPAEEAAVAQRLSSLTGLSVEFIRQSNLRVSQPRFCKELLRSRGLHVGRFDSRFAAGDRDDAGERGDFDPSHAAIRGVYAAAFNHYLREELGYRSDMPYEILTGRVHPWDYGQAGNNQYVNVAERLRSVMHQAPSMRVFLASGYTDLATPYFAADYTMDHLMLRPALRDNIETQYYGAGHMMYLQASDRAKLRADLAAWYGSTLSRDGR